MNEDVAHVYLGFKCVTLNISNEEIVDLMRLCQKRYTKRMGILENRLREIGSSIEKLKKTEPDKANFLINTVRRFHEKRYNAYGKFPLYLNLDGFCTFIYAMSKIYKLVANMPTKTSFSCMKKILKLSCLASFMA